jgi:hypothetical protein
MELDLSDCPGARGSLIGPSHRPAGGTNMTSQENIPYLHRLSSELMQGLSRRLGSQCRKRKPMPKLFEEAFGT